MPRLAKFYSVDQADWKLWKKSAVLRQETVAFKRELVRQWVLRELLTTYQYPVAWLGSRILAVDDQEFFGLSFSTCDGHPFLLVSVAPPNRSNDAEAALCQRLVASCHAGLGVSVDGTEDGTRFIRRRFDSDKYDYLVDLEPYREPGRTPGPQPFIAPHRTNHKQFLPSLTPLPDRLESLFFEIHSLSRDIDGLHADEALDELCKVLYVKLFDEHMAAPGQAYKMQRWIYGSSEELATAVRVLYDAARLKGLAAPEKLTTKAQQFQNGFSAPIRLSSSALSRIVEALQSFHLTQSTADVKGRAFQKVISPLVRAGMGQYFTPDEVIRFVVRVVDPSPTELVLDPFAGSGRFLSACRHWLLSHDTNPRQPQSSLLPRQYLHGIEKAERMVRVATVDMHLQGDEHTNIRCEDSLLDFSNYVDLVPQSFDIVVTNPPFGSLLGQEALSTVGVFDLALGRSSVPLEILGLERCVQFLRPGGRMGIVLPEGILANQNTRHVRAWLEERCRIRAIVSLPIETFSPYGANVKTCVLFARKRRVEEKQEPDFPVALVRVDSVGYDASGRTADSSELDEAAEAVEAFLGREGW